MMVFITDALQGSRLQPFSHILLRFFEDSAAKFHNQLHKLNMQICSHVFFIIISCETSEGSKN